MNACHISAKASAKVRLCQPCSNMLIIKGFMRVSLTEMKSEYYPPFKDEGELIASWGEARLINYLDGKLVLKGGSKADRIAAREWISMF